MRTDIDLVHVIFKTHFDLGFTDYARVIIDRYLNKFIPDAIALAEDMQAHHPDEPFRWTAGAWLFHEYLERATPERRTQFEHAVANNLVAWHALPFTTHTELMDERLFRYGLSLSKGLDQRFGKQTIAAKMTDVPGHTRAMIPLLAEANIRFFHVGVNPASTVPDVPPVFVWRDEATSTELVVMYQKVYGDVMVLPGTTQAVALVFTGDNLGPPSRLSVHETYTKLRQEFPNATFIGSTLDAVAEALHSAQAELPIITDEIGDTWIRGIGTDPSKVSRYRELLRLRNRWIDEGRNMHGRLNAFHHALLMVPEHTWGMDLKTFLPDYEHYETQALASRRSDPMYQHFEASWEEQRAYITDALDTLQGTPLRFDADACLGAIAPRHPDLAQFRPMPKARLETTYWSIDFDPETGALNHLVRKVDATPVADPSHPIGKVLYETFSAQDYDRFWHQYIRDREFGEVRVWAHPDNTKPGLNVNTHGWWYPRVRSISMRDDGGALRILVVAGFADEAREIGAPETMTMEYRFAPDGTIDMDVQWFGKPACRLPEAFWLTIQPVEAGAGPWAIHKLDGKIDPVHVVSNGARTLHGVHDTVEFHGPHYSLEIDSLDAVLVAPGRPSLLDFHNQLPDMADGVHFNLFNNAWGTNFPMWFDDDARFRFALRIR